MKHLNTHELKKLIFNVEIYRKMTRYSFFYCFYINLEVDQVILNYKQSIRPSGFPMLKTHLDLREVHTWEFKLNFKKQT